MFPLKCLLPSLLTVSSTVLGILAWWMLSQQHFGLMFGFIVGAAIIDRFDGQCARALDCETLIGKRLDVINDVWVFVGVTTLIFLHLSPLTLVLTVMCAVLYGGCGVSRLIRFYYQSDSTVVIGLPVTLASPILVGSMLWIRANPSTLSLSLTVGVMLSVSLLMIAPFKVKKF